LKIEPASWGISPATAALLLGASLSLAGCAAKDVLPRGQQAYALMPAPSPTAPTNEYRIGPLDQINVTVFQEPDLSLRDAQVNAAGLLSVPLIGTVQAAGRTPEELSKDISGQLGTRYLVHPQVSIVVTSSVSQKVTVEGNVNQPGVFDIQGQTTLLKALALARSPTRVAAVDEVVIFRTVNGQRMGALFDVNAIRRGRSPDPQILGNDIVVVGFSTLKGVYRDFITAVPAFAVFRPY
jgi:polysaccharide export outer membrane protein